MENSNENQDLTSKKLDPAYVLSIAKEKGLKQVDLAAIYNLTQGRVSQVFAGQGPETLQLFYYFATSLKVSKLQKPTKKAIKEAKREAARLFIRTYSKQVA